MKYDNVRCSNFSHVLCCRTLHSLERPSSEEIRQEVKKNTSDTPTSNRDEANADRGAREEPVKQSKGYLREALANSAGGVSTIDSGRTDVLLDESDIQPTGMNTQIPLSPEIDRRSPDMED